MMTKEQMPWIDYATYDECDFIKGVRKDAPDEIRKAYEKHQREIQKHINAGMRMAK